MTGDGVIVMRLDNGHGPFYEHTSLVGARAEAHRLAREVGGEFVIYVPVAVVKSASIQERAVEIRDARFDDLPF